MKSGHSKMEKQAVYLSIWASNDGIHPVCCAPSLAHKIIRTNNLGRPWRRQGQLSGVAWMANWVISASFASITR